MTSCRSRPAVRSCKLGFEKSRDASPLICNPKDETIFHCTWSDSARFLAVNPSNNYLVFLDPIYMHRFNANLFQIYQSLNRGAYPDPYNAFKIKFKTQYGFTRKSSGLFRQLKKLPQQFEFIYENNLGAVFKVL